MALVLAWIAAAILFVILALVLLPVRFRFGLSRDSKWRFTVHVAPFNGHVPFVGVVDSQRRASGPTTDKQTPEPVSRRSVRHGLPSRRLMGSFARFVTDLIQALRVEHAQAEITFGLSDPAETGHIFGLLAPLVYGAGQKAPGPIVIRPDFERQVLSGEAMLEVSVVPARLLPSGVGVARAFLREKRS